MITCDTNVLIMAAKYHLNVARGDMQSKAAHMLAMRKNKNFAVTDVVAGEVAYGSGTEAEIGLMLQMIPKMKMISVARADLGIASKLIRLLGRKKRKACNDCLIYTAASRNKIEYVASWDAGFVGEKNRVRVPQALFSLGIRTPASCVTPTEVIIMPHINPKKKLTVDQKAMKEANAYRNRAWARARSIVGDDPEKILWLFAKTGQMIARQYAS
jgi:predicted nucleic acid-binding protein